jgi:hypothetical protein
MFDFGLLKDLPMGDWVAVSDEQNRVLTHGPKLEDVIHAADQTQIPYCITRVFDWSTPLILQTHPDHRENLDFLILPTSLTA